MIYILCVGIVCLSGYVGSLVARTFVFKDKFYKEMLSLVLWLKNNINFNRLKLADVLNDFLKNSDKKLEKQMTIVKKIILGQISEEEFINSVSLYFLKKEEKATLVRYLKDVGSGNDVVELDKYEGFKQYLENKSNEAENSRKKNEALAYKLSIAIGVVVSILII